MGRVGTGLRLVGAGPFGSAQGRLRPAATQALPPLFAPRAKLQLNLLARTFLNNGRYQACYGVLENATILPFEGQRDVHELFVQCQICLAMEAMKKGRYDDAIKRLEGSKEFPVRLGTGKPQDPDYRIQDYLMMLTYDKMGAAAKAEEAQKRIAAYSVRNPRVGSDSAKARVDQWYQTAFTNQGELQALKELINALQGNRRRRE